MPPSKARRRVLTATVAVLAVVAFVVSLYQPWLAQWGSTASERATSLPGDDVVPDPDRSWTRSITIDAPPDQVWRWLVQIGVDRAGFYTYDWGEQLAGDPVHNATSIHPEWQTLEPGDAVHPFPDQDWQVVAVEPDRLLVLGGDGWSWTTVLLPVDDGRTRVVTRMRSASPSALSVALDPADLIVFPRLLTGLKQRAEGTLPGQPGTDTGRPLPTARLPVDWWAATAWLLGLALFGGLTAPLLGLGRWRRRRPHPGITTALAAVAGAGYALMSDTPPVQFVVRRWGLGLVGALALGVALARLVPWPAPEPSAPGRRFPRALTALAETGLFVVVPATAVWQAATALGRTESWTGSLATGLASTIAASVVGWLAWRRGSGPVPAAILAVALAAGFVTTGSGLVALLGALVIELSPGRRAPTAAEPAEVAAGGASGPARS